MAIPPEPIDSVLFDAKAVVVAEVVAVTETGPALPKVERKKGHTDVGNKEPWQTLTLKVSSVLMSGLDVRAGATVSVKKPEGDYTLVTGNQGDFLLGTDIDGLVILGRYGPDSYRHDVVVAALARRR
jgi:hypothetical protein